MLKYIFKRVLIFIPTLIVISLMTFVISINAPGDPVETMLNQNMGGDGQSGEKLANEQTYIDKRKELGFDLPLFYFSFTNKTYPDTLYKIPRKAHRETLQRLSYEYGVWENVGQYYKNLQKLELKVFEVMPNEENSSKLRKIKDNLSSLYLTYEEDKIKQTVENIEFDIFKDKNIKLSVEKEFFDFKNSYEHMLVDKKTINRYIPTIYWYGLKNQYHQWISNFVVGEFGISYKFQNF